MGRVTFLVSAGAARTELAGRHGDGWKARVGAPPERGRANEALVRLVAEALAVARTDVRVAAGRSSRSKVLEVDGLADAEIGRRLEAYSRSGKTSWKRAPRGEAGS
jgi:uncharacterized protein YggU (UPF0235/DUF167 family)